MVFARGRDWALGGCEVFGVRLDRLLGSLKAVFVERNGERRRRKARGGKSPCRFSRGRRSRVVSAELS